MAIRMLTEKEIILIAAGEVVERPASVLKELVENALDAGAQSVQITLLDGGNSLIRVQDNGSGIPKDELNIAIERHATSKVKFCEVMQFEYFGFRGEALAAIGAVSNMKITSMVVGQDVGWEISVEGGRVSALSPAKHIIGTTVEVRDLFAYVPARLKFMKSARIELSQCLDLINRMAFVYPDREFKLYEQNKCLFHSSGEGGMGIYEEVIGKGFLENSVDFQLQVEGMKVYGRASVPTYDAGAKSYVFVNNRIVKDKFLLMTLKIAYQGLMFAARSPTVVLFLEMEPYLVDVNVSPTKMEVRFTNEQAVRGLIIKAIRNMLAQDVSKKVSTTVAQQAIERKIDTGLREAQNPIPYYKMGAEDNTTITTLAEVQKNVEFLGSNYNKPIIPSIKLSAPANSQASPSQPEIENFVEQNDGGYLGRAKFQIANTYIVAESQNGLVIIDQHAAHERIVLERMKKQWLEGGIEMQLLLLPEIVELESSLAILIAGHTEDLRRLGFDIKCYGAQQIVVHSMPSILENFDFQRFFSTLGHALKEDNDIAFAYENIEEILGNMACRASIKAGKTLSLEEMNSILRMMENTSFSGQCNHGRPTHTVFSFGELEKLFKRTG
jgi:DNA mismatch repair protein MutL